MERVKIDTIATLAPFALADHTGHATDKTVNLRSLFVHALSNASIRLWSSPYEGTIDPVIDDWKDATSSTIMADLHPTWNALALCGRTEGSRSLAVIEFSDFESAVPFFDSAIDIPTTFAVKSRACLQLWYYVTGDVEPRDFARAGVHIYGEGEYVPCPVSCVTSFMDHVPQKPTAADAIAARDASVCTDYYEPVIFTRIEHGYRVDEPYDSAVSYIAQIATLSPDGFHNIVRALDGLERKATKSPDNTAGFSLGVAEGTTDGVPGHPITAKNGRKKPCIANVLLALDQSDKARNSLASDAIDGSIILTQCPWPGSENERYPRPYNADFDSAQGRAWLDTIGLSVSAEIFQSAVTAYAHAGSHRINRVSDHMDAFVGDMRVKLTDDPEKVLVSTDAGLTYEERQSQLRHCLLRILGVPEDELSREKCRIILGVIWVRSHETRSFKSDYFPIFIGQQGTGKSSICRLLAGEDPRRSEGFYIDLKTDPGSRDNQLLMTHAPVVELGEMDSFSKTDSGHVKAIMSSDVWRYRRPYDRATVSVPRISTFIGTSNLSQPLRDLTGSRRPLVLKSRWGKSECYVYEQRSIDAIRQAYAECQAVIERDGIDSFKDGLLLSDELTKENEAFNEALTEDTLDSDMLRQWLCDRAQGGMYLDALNRYRAGHTASCPAVPEPWHKGDVIDIPGALREGMAMTTPEIQRLKGRARSRYGDIINEFADMWEEHDAKGHSKTWTYIGPEPPKKQKPSLSAAVVTPQMPTTVKQSAIDAVTSAITGKE